MLIDRGFGELLPGADATSDPTERRANPRIPLETDITLASTSRVQTGVVLDVSAGGVCAAAYAPLAVGERASVRFRLPTGTVVATGSVCWVREGRPGSIPRMGIAFSEIGEDDRDALRRFCGERPRFLSDEEIVAATH
jgi:hypothetical protein